MKFYTIFTKIFKILIIITTLIYNNNISKASELSTVNCNKDVIAVEISLPNNASELPIVYFENFQKRLLDICQPSFSEAGVVFKIYLKDFYKCGFTRVVNKLMGLATFHQNLILEQNHTIISTTSVKCSYKIKISSTKFKQKIVKREALPDNFQEDDDLEILETLQQQAPEPEVKMEVRQNNQLIDGMVTVIPGTPLVMEVKLNDLSANIYGLNIKYLEVSDARDTSETIIFRGCTVDPYLFENFNISEKHSLKSKFRAFKFPNTAYIQFRANVQICLNKCPDPQCTNGQQGQNRRKRDIEHTNKHSLEVSVGLLMKINDSAKGNDVESLKLQNHVKHLMMKNLNLRKFY